MTQASVPPLTEISALINKLMVSGENPVLLDEIIKTVSASASLAMTNKALVTANAQLQAAHHALANHMCEEESKAPKFPQKFYQPPHREVTAQMIQKIVDEIFAVGTDNEGFFITQGNIMVARFIDHKTGEAHIFVATDYHQCQTFDE
jgi:hypothetical protein